MQTLSVSVRVREWPKQKQNKECCPPCTFLYGTRLFHYWLSISLQQYYFSFGLLLTRAFVTSKQTIEEKIFVKKTFHRKRKSKRGSRNKKIKSEKIERQTENERNGTGKR